MPNLLSRLTLISLLVMALMASGCAGLINDLVPDVYLVDRQTLMEADASGDWPEVEQRLIELGLETMEQPKTGPEPFAGSQDTLSEQTTYGVLNAEYTAEKAHQ